MENQAETQKLLMAAIKLSVTERYWKPPNFPKHHAREMKMTTREILIDRILILLICLLMAAPISIASQWVF